MNNTAAIIFSAGKGTRLRPLTEKIPKPLLEVAEGRSLIDFSIESLIDIGIRDIIINFSYAEDLFRKKIDTYKSSCNVMLVKEEGELLGQGGTILKNLNILRKYDRVLCSNGDTFAKYDRNAFLDHHSSLKSSLTALSDRNINLPRDIICNLNDKVIGCRIKDTDYLYQKHLVKLFRRFNYLGEFVFNPHDIEEKEYTEEFRGLFGNDDLIEILVHNKKFATMYNKEVEYFLSMNTIEEYESVKNFCNTHSKCLHTHKNF